MNKRGFEISLVALVKLTLGIMLVTAGFLYTQRALDDQQLQHLYAVKTTSLHVDALASIQGNGQLRQDFPQQISLTKQRQDLIVADESETYLLRTPAVVQTQQNLDIDTGTSTHYRFTKNSEDITVTNNIREVEKIYLCPEEQNEVTLVTQNPLFTSLPLSIVQNKNDAVNPITIIESDDSKVYAPPQSREGCVLANTLQIPLVAFPEIIIQHNNMQEVAQALQVIA